MEVARASPIYPINTAILSTLKSFCKTSFSVYLPDGTRCRGAYYPGDCGSVEVYIHGFHSSVEHTKARFSSTTHSNADTAGPTAICPADEVVPVSLSHQFTAISAASDVTLRILKDGEHALNRHLPLIAAGLDGLFQKIREPETV